MELKNGCLEVLELVALFLPKTKTYDAKNIENCVDAIFHFALLRLVSKTEGQIQSYCKFDE